MQKSYRAPNPGENRPWFIIDAKDQPVGRLAVVIANKLRAKDLPTFDPSVDAASRRSSSSTARCTASSRRRTSRASLRNTGSWGKLQGCTVAGLQSQNPETL